MMMATIRTNPAPPVIDFIGAEFDSSLAPYQRMANVIIHLTLKKGDCLPADLWASGFSRQETNELWHMAEAMAAVELRLMKKMSSFDFKSEDYHA